MRKIGLLASGTIWFGAAVSIAEIEAGCQAGGNWPALILGHLFGGILLFGAGLIGARTGQNAMETTGGTFGQPGVKFFALLNILQLVGWTAVMISQGARAIGALTNTAWTLWCLPLSVLILLWMFGGHGGASRLGTGCIILLAILCAILTVHFCGLPAPEPLNSRPPQAFWVVFETSAAMSLSWLPLVSDYTKHATRPRMVPAISAAVYTLTSLWMFSLGFFIADSGHSDLVKAVASMGHGTTLVGLFVITLSTMTTTFFDVYSAGESAGTVSTHLKPRPVSTLVCAIGMGLATLGIMDHYLGFLSLIASVFAPMAAVLLTDVYLVGKGHTRWNLLAWFVGFIVYQFAGISPVGPTLTAIAVAGALTFIRRFI